MQLPKDIYSEIINHLDISTLYVMTWISKEINLISNPLMTRKRAEFYEKEQEKLKTSQCLVLSSHGHSWLNKEEYGLIIFETEEEGKYICRGSLKPNEIIVDLNAQEKRFCKYAGLRIIVSETITLSDLKHAVQTDNIYVYKI